MDNKVTKQRVGNHLEYDWYKYILVIAVAVTVVLVLFSQINKTRVEEKFSLFFSAYLYNQVDFYGEVKSAAAKDYDEEKYGKDILRTVSFEFLSPFTEGYADVLVSRAFSADAMIVPKSYLYDEEYGTVRTAMGFVPFDDRALADIGIGEGYDFLRLDESGKQISEGGTIFAVRVDNLTKLSALNVAKFKFDDGENEHEPEFYLVVARHGANVGKINKKDKAENRQTYFCLKVFFDLYGL